MGFYRNGKENTPRSTGAWRWMVMVVLSALVGSGATLAVETTLPHVSTASAASTNSHSSPSESTAQPLMSTATSASNGVTQVVKRVEPDVVGVVNYSTVSNFFTQQSKLEATGVGTGVMFYKDSKYAYLVTNNHVVEGASKVSIVPKSGKHIDATVVGTDPFTDLAVLKVPVANFKGIQPASFANSDKIQVGQTAIAIGTPMGLSFADTVTKGIISAKSRVMPVEDEKSKQTLDYQSVIQTDAAINPGNSGGPLLNSAGQVMGINSSKIVAQNFNGMGFAIPSNEVQTIADELMKTGHASHPDLGIAAYSLSELPQQMWPQGIPVDYGVWIKSVSSSKTKKAGLKAGDVIVGFDGKAVKTVADLRTYLFQKKPGDTVTLSVYEGNQKKDIKVTLGTMNTQLTTNGSSQNQNAVPTDPFNPFGSKMFQ